MGLGGLIKKAVGVGASVVGAASGNPWISAAGSALGGMIGTDAANSASAAATKDQMAWQEKMRSTQYQTAVKDLQKAGLNPRLAYQQGGAGNLSGSVADVRDSSSSAREAAVQAATIRNMGETTKQIASQTELNKANATAALASANSANSVASLNMTKTQLEASKLPWATAKGSFVQNIKDRLHGRAAEYRQRGFKDMWMKSTPSQGGGWNAIRGWAANRFGF